MDVRRFREDLYELTKRACNGYDQDIRSKVFQIADILVGLYKKNLVKINHSALELVCAMGLVKAGYDVKVELQLDKALVCDVMGTKAEGTLIVEIETGFIPPEAALAPSAYARGRIASKIARYSRFADKFALGTTPSYVLDIPPFFARPQRERTAEEVSEIKALTDVRYTKPPVTLSELMHARLHSVFVIDVDSATSREIDPRSYLEAASTFVKHHHPTKAYIGTGAQEGAGSHSKKLEPEDPVGETSSLTSGTSSGKIALAQALFNIGALRFGKFTLSSGRRSSYYLDLRMIPSYPETYALAIQAYSEIAKGVGEKNFDVVAGVATAGVTISSPLAFLLKKPMVYVRKEEKGHGLGRQVEGATRPGQKTLVIDDLITTGGSIISAVEALRKTGCVVKDAAVLVDRLEGGKANLAGAGVRLNAYAQVTELIEILYQSRMMTKGDYEAVAKQIKGGNA